MNSTLPDRIAGLLFGSLIGDALALGPHWIYDQGQLQREFGRVTGYLKPGPDSYHPGKAAGQQTHYGDQTLVLLESIQTRGGFDLAGFAEDWRNSWNGYEDYRDHATRETLSALDAGKSFAEAASPSVELGGAARIAPILAAMAGRPVEEAINAARAQTGLTHGSEIAGDAAEFLTRLVFAFLDGEKTEAAIASAAGADYAVLDLKTIRLRIQAVSALDTAQAASELGLACPAPLALPAVLMLLERYGDNFESALIENVMAGGDNAARGLALGMMMGAKLGKTAIPESWLGGLTAAPRVTAFLDRLSSR